MSLDVFFEQGDLERIVDEAEAMTRERGHAIAPGIATLMAAAADAAHQNVSREDFLKVAAHAFDACATGVAGARRGRH